MRHFQLLCGIQNTIKMCNIYAKNCLEFMNGLRWIMARMSNIEYEFAAFDYEYRRKKPNFNWNE